MDLAPTAHFGRNSPFDELRGAFAVETGRNVGKVVIILPGR